jgi:hypothetical protein
VLMDSAAIMAAQSGSSQLSVGYGAKLVWGDGVTPGGERYHATQSEIRANHIALVRVARGGDKLKIGDQDDLFDDACEDQHDDYFDREFSQKERKTAASKGQAMSHGGFPIKSGGDLRNAVRAIGRAKNPAAAKAHIKKRARALGLTKLLPSSWGDGEGDHDEGGQQRRRSMTERTLNLDGVNIALEDKDGQILERHLAGLTKKIGDQDSELDALRESIADLETALAEAKKLASTKDGEIAALNTKLEDGKITPEKLDQALSVRMDVVDRATTFFGDTKYDWQKKTDAQIRRDVVTARMGEQKAKAMNDDAVEGAFLSLTEPEQQDGFQRLTQSFSRGPAANLSDAAAAAYNKRNDSLQNAWKRNKGKVA